MDDQDLASTASMVIMEVSASTYHAVALRLHCTADKAICMPHVGML